MTITRIKWFQDEGLSYIGRNGSGKCCGLEVNKYESIVTIMPINSRGSVSNCLIDFPNKSILELIQAFIPLDKILDAVQDRLPTLLGLDKVLDGIIEERLKSGLDHVDSPGQKQE